MAYGFNEDKSKCDVYSVEDLAPMIKSDPIYYGADPTGGTSSSEAIAECIAANIGGTVCFSPGSYLIDEPISTPFPAAEKINIDFNGASVIAAAGLDVMIDVGGYNQGTGQEGGSFQPYIRGGKLLGNGSCTGILHRSKFKSIIIECMNIKDCPIAIYTESGAPSDTQINKCNLMYTDVLEEGSVGISYNGSDNKISDCKIIGFRTGIFNNAGGLFARNVHFLPKASDSSYIEDDDVCCFVLKAGAIIDSCYGDTYPTFIKVKKYDAKVQVVNSLHYSYREFLNMNFIWFDTGDADYRGMCYIANNTYYPRLRPDGTKNKSFKFSKNIAGTFVKTLHIKDNHINDASLAYCGDLMSASDNLEAYYYGHSQPLGNWYPIAIVPLANVRFAGKIDFTFTRYFSIQRSCQVQGIVSLNSDTGLPVFIGTAFGENDCLSHFGYNFYQDDVMLYMVLYTDIGNTNYSIVSNNSAIVTPPIPKTSHLISVANASELYTDNIDVNNVTLFTVKS